MDRLGVKNIQNDPMLTIKTINKILDNNIEIRWLTRENKLITENYPEGHFFQSGAFLIEGNSDTINQMKENNIYYDITESQIGENIKPINIALYNGKGTAEFCIDPIVEVLNLSSFKYRLLSDNDIREGLLDESDTPITSGLVAGQINTIDMIYWEGPAMKVLSDKVKIIAKYSDFIASGCKSNFPNWDLLDNYLAIKSIKEWYNKLTETRFEKYLKNKAAILETNFNNNRIVLISPHAEFGNIGISPRKKSQAFQLIINTFFYLSLNKQII